MNGQAACEAEFGKGATYNNVQYEDACGVGVGWTQVYCQTFPVDCPCKSQTLSITMCFQNGLQGTPWEQCENYIGAGDSPSALVNEPTRVGDCTVPVGTAQTAPGTAWNCPYKTMCGEGNGELTAPSGKCKGGNGVICVPKSEWSQKMSDYTAKGVSACEYAFGQGATFYEGMDNYCSGSNGGAVFSVPTHSMLYCTSFPAPCPCKSVKRSISLCYHKSMGMGSTPAAACQFYIGAGAAPAAVGEPTKIKVGYPAAASCNLPEVVNGRGLEGEMYSCPYYTLCDGAVVI